MNNSRFSQLRTYKQVPRYATRKMSYGLVSCMIGCAVLTGSITQATSVYANTTDAPAAASNASAATQKNFVMPTEDIYIHNRNFVSRRDISSIVDAVKKVNNKGVESVSIDEKTGEVVVSYNDKTSAKKSLSAFKRLLKSQPKEPIIRNGGQNISSDEGYVARPADKKNKVEVFRGDSLTYTVEVAKGRVKEVKDDENSKYAIYDLLKSAPVVDNKYVLTESFTLTENLKDANPKDTPKLYAEGLIKGVENKGFEGTKNYVEGTAKENQFLGQGDKANEISPAVRIYRMKGTAALNETLGRHEVTYRVKAKDVKSDIAVGVMNINVAPQKDKYEPTPQFKDGKTSLEIKKDTELTVEKVKEILKLQAKKNPSAKDYEKNLANLPENTKLVIVGKLDPNKKGEVQNVEIKVVYPDNQGGETNGDSIDTFELPVTILADKPVVGTDRDANPQPPANDPKDKDKDAGKDKDKDNNQADPARPVNPAPAPAPVPNEPKDPVRPAPSRDNAPKDTQSEVTTSASVSQGNNENAIADKEVTSRKKAHAKASSKKTALPQTQDLLSGVFGLASATLGTGFVVFGAKKKRNR